MRDIIRTAILKNKEIVPNIYEMILEAGDLVDSVLPGQFVNLYCPSEARILPRPISICEVDQSAKTLKLIYAVVGKGTEIFSKMQVGGILKMVGPLGNGFTINTEWTENIVIGGGVGIPPLLELAKKLKGNTSVFLGFRKDPFLIEDFKKYSTVYVATEDGSAGIKGNVLDLLEKQKNKAQMVYSCGPKPMLKALVQWAGKKQIPIQVSLEERMACGIGACLVCACRIKKKEETDWQNSRICKDGPVFWGDEVIWE
jgi:dihydroorotate dehydrogenase electron transfer subunit